MSECRLRSAEVWRAARGLVSPSPARVGSGVAARCGGFAVAPASYELQGGAVNSFRGTVVIHFIFGRFFSRHDSLFVHLQGVEKFLTGSCGFC